MNRSDATKRCCRATNFQVALPHLDQNLLDSARKQFVFHLKDAIKVSVDPVPLLPSLLNDSYLQMEKDRLVQSYKLDERLAELDELTREADKRNEEARRKRTTAGALHHDAWRSVCSWAVCVFCGLADTFPKYREGIDLDTAIHAPLIPQSKRRIAALEEELKEITMENEEGFLKLSDTLKEEKSRRQAAKDSLTWLEEVSRLGWCGVVCLLILTYRRSEPSKQAKRNRRLSQTLSPNCWRRWGHARYCDSLSCCVRRHVTYRCTFLKAYTPSMA